MKTLKDVNLSGKRVFVRVDFNVPLDEMQNITDDTRIRFVVPTLKYAIDNKSKLIIASHLGRPKGKVAPQYSLAPVFLKSKGIDVGNSKIEEDLVKVAATIIRKASEKGIRPIFRWTRLPQTLSLPML